MKSSKRNRFASRDLRALILSLILVIVILEIWSSVGRADSNWDEILSTKKALDLEIIKTKQEHSTVRSRACAIENSLGRPPIHCFTAGMRKSDQELLTRLCLERSSGVMSLPEPDEMTPEDCRAQIEKRRQDLVYAAQVGATGRAALRHR